MLLTNQDNIRDVIAFPKTQNHSCLMTKAPGTASLDQLIDLGLSIDDF
jgi:aspartyl-tRNA synthetase